MGPSVYEHPSATYDAAPPATHLGLHLDLDLTMIDGHLRRDLSQQLNALEALRAESRAVKAVSWQPYSDEGMADLTTSEQMEIDLAELIEITSPLRKRKRTLDSAEEDRYTCNRKARKIASLKRSVSQSLKQPLQITSPNTPPPTKSSFLRPCRICHSSPKSKKHVAGFLSCARCGGWTCTVCQRFCETESCRYHVAATCSSCCVENGANWELHCRDCAYGAA